MAHPRRRAKAGRSFRAFCETYGSGTFTLEWSADHLAVIECIDDTVRHGGLFAMAMMRGAGKTSLCEWAVKFATLYGLRRFPVLIGATEEDAEARLESIKAELEGNDLLLEDFPEVCYPIRALDGIVHRAAGQLCGGERTRIEWGAKSIVLPTIAGSKASGVVVKIAGITGRIRGMNHKRHDGASVRPDLAVVDDPQTDESAASASQCRQRERVLSGAVLGLAGPGKKIAGFMPCTVIRRGDMADRILDTKVHPSWHGRRMRMVYAWPTRMDLWEQYRELRAESLRNGGKGEAATEFYAANREAMDAGAQVAWEARRNPDELSALQHAMNLRFYDEASFFAEYQNDPMPEDDAPRTEMRADDIVRRGNGLARGRVPLGATRLTAFVDVQKSVLWWMVCAWCDDFTGSIVDYGAWPDQGRAHFTMRQATQTLQLAFPGAGIEGAVHGGLEGLSKHLLAREWLREDSSPARIERMLVDANWGESTHTVYDWCRRTEHAAVVTPSHGKFFGATSAPFHEWRRRPGERLGLHWRLGSTQGRQAVRHVLMDVNWWKSFLAARLGQAVGDRGALTLFGRRGDEHLMLAEHLTAERPVPVTAKGRTVDEWKPVSVGRDNHLLDCLVGCAVGASMQGVSLEVGGAKQETGRARRKVRLSDWNRGKRG